MSFVDNESRVRPASIAAVALVHVAVGYAIVSGLAITVITHVPGVTFVKEIAADPPPPPEIQPQPRAARTPTTMPPLTPNPILPPQTTTQTIEVGQIPILPPQTDPSALPPSLPPARASQAHGAITVGDRAAWVTTEDYPASALRQNAEGTTGITVTVGADGRVSACRVIATSGNDALDEATCRTYTRRARFRPAVDAEGRPIAADHADRVRWQLPKE